MLGFFLLDKKLLEQFTSTQIVLPHEYGPSNMGEIEILVLQISTTTCTCRSNININEVVYRMCILMNFCEIKHDGQQEPLTDQKLVKQQYFTVISTFFPSFVLPIFTRNLTTFFPGNFTSVLCYVRLIYLISFFSNLILFLQNSFPRLFLLIFFFFWCCFSSQGLLLLSFFRSVTATHLRIFLVSVTVQPFPIYFFYSHFLTYAIVLSLAFVSGFIKGVQEVAERQGIAITVHKHIFYESPYISRVQVIDSSHCSDKERNIDRYGLEFLFCLTK